MSLQGRLVVWKMGKWLKKYPVLFSVLIVSGATLASVLGSPEVSQVITEVGERTALTPEATGAPVSTEQLVLLVTSLINMAGVGMKVLSEHRKRAGMKKLGIAKDRRGQRP